MTNNPLAISLEEIRAFYKARGLQELSMHELEARLAALGYKLDRTMDCRAPCQFRTGELAGRSYACCSAYAVEIDTGIG